MSKYLIQLEVELPKDFQESLIDEAIADAIFNEGGQVINSKEYVKITAGYKGPFPQWIPVTKKLPKKEGVYIASFDDGFVTGVEWFEGEWGLWADSGEVVAWMPCPKAYKEEEKK